MSLGEIALAVLLLIVPLGFLAYLLLSWTSGRGPGRRRSVLGAGTRGDIVAVATTTARAAESTQVSIATQIGVVAHQTIQALGYLVARLRGSAGAPLLGVRDGEETVHVVAAGASYALDVHFQLEPPASYQGARVELAAFAPVRLAVHVGGDGLGVSDEGRATLVVERPGPGAIPTLHVTARTEGRTRLRVNLYRDNAWAQTLDMALDVRTPGGVERLRGGVAVGGTVEGSNTLTPAVPDPAPRRLQMTFWPTGSGYGGDAGDGRQGDGRRTLRLTLSEHDLQDLNQGLRDALDTLRKHFGDEVTVSEEGRAAPETFEILDQLARRGHAAFQRLFPDESDRDYIISALAGAGDAGVEIASEALFLPWEALYDTYDPHDVRVENFWGFRHNIGRVLTAVRQTPSPRIVVPHVPRIVLFANPDLTEARDREVPFFHALHGGGRIRLRDWLADVHPETDEAPLRERRLAFAAYCRAEPSDVAHFACHAVAGKLSDDSYLQLSAGLRLTLLDMRVDRCTLPGSPLVVLNACGTSVRDPLKTSDFVRGFMLSGGRGVVATECDVPDLFASVFVQDVYDRLLGGVPVSTALLETRRAFLKTHGNPLGLLYAAYTAIDTRIERPAEPPPRA